MNGFAPRGENDRAPIAGLGSTAEPEDSSPANERSRRCVLSIPIHGNSIWASADRIRPPRLLLQSDTREFREQ